MTRFTDRVTRDLHQIADRSTPSSTAWDSIRTRIDEQADQPPTMEVIVLSPDHNDSPKRGWMLAAAAVAGLAIVGGLVFATTRSNDDTVPADTPTATLPAAPAPDAGVDPDPEAAVVPAPDPTTAAETESVETTLATNPTLGGYESADRSQIPSLVDGVSAPISTPLPDGSYWTWEYVSDGSTVEFTLSQLFTGDACREQFGDGDGACASDNDTLYEPSATVTMSADEGFATVIATDDQGFIEHYRVSGAEFASLVAGGAPASDAPEGFLYQPAGAFVTVRDGRVIAADQVFMS